MSLLRRLREFTIGADKAAAAELRRQLLTLESNCGAAFAALEAGWARRLQVKQRITNADGETVAPGQSLGITANVASVQLAPPGPGDAGKFLAICKGAGAPSNTEVYAPARSLVNGASTFTITTSGLLQLLYCDGVDYWAVP